MNNKDIITLAHGSGGSITQELISHTFYKHFTNDILLSADDAATLTGIPERIAFTTDSFVVSPIFFTGGNIGKLSVCGTVNDLTAAGAKALYLSCGFIVEEGFKIYDLEKIVISMAQTCSDCGVKIVTGDTKVVQRGAADKIFINTTGIGAIYEGVNVSGSYAKPGDCVIVSGAIGDHGCSIMIDRNMPGLIGGVSSDCAPLNKMIEMIYEVTKDIHVLRDPTRGGIATVLNEIAVQSDVAIYLNQGHIPVNGPVQGACSLLGLEPLYLANEGKMVIVAPQRYGKDIVKALKCDQKGKDAAIIGYVDEAPKKRVIMKTGAGGSRILDIMSADQLPRIC